MQFRSVQAIRLITLGGGGKPSQIVLIFFAAMSFLSATIANAQVASHASGAGPSGISARGSNVKQSDIDEAEVAATIDFAAAKRIGSKPVDCNQSLAVSLAAGHKVLVGGKQFEQDQAVDEILKIKANKQSECLEVNVLRGASQQDAQWMERKLDGQFVYRRYSYPHDSN